MPPPNPDGTPGSSTSGVPDPRAPPAAGRTNSNPGSTPGFGRGGQNGRGGSGAFGRGGFGSGFGTGGSPAPSATSQAERDRAQQAADAAYQVLMDKMADLLAKLDAGTVEAQTMKDAYDRINVELASSRQNVVDLQTTIADLNARLAAGGGANTADLDKAVLELTARTAEVDAASDKLAFLRTFLAID